MLKGISPCMMVKTEKQPWCMGTEYLSGRWALYAKASRQIGLDKHCDIIIEVSNEGVPVYRVQRESGDSTIKTLLRNMLLPFSAMPV